jgi:hypothetical protein
MLEYESFSIYGFRIDYPSSWKIELDPKSERNTGNVVVKSPQKAHIFVSWGLLEKVKRKYSSLDEQAQESLKRMTKSCQVEEVRVVQSNLIKVSSHKAKFMHVKIITVKPRLFPIAKPEKSEQEAYSLFLHCSNTKRYFVIYGIIAHDKSREYEEIFMNMIKSFQCHMRL